MVGKKEASRLGWIWLHYALGWKFVYFLDMNISFEHDYKNEDDNDTFKFNTNYVTKSNQTDNDYKYDDNDDINMIIITSISTCLSYKRYIRLYYKKHLQIIELITGFCGHLFGWKPPWISHDIQKLYKNLKMYKRIYSYPSQSLMDDDKNEQSKIFMKEYNKNNILSDSILVSTKTNGYWLGNILTGNWYELGIEQPYLKNLHHAISRGSMSIELFPRSNRLYFGGGLVCSMPISTVVGLDIDQMKLEILSEMENPRAYLSMTFYPDCLMFIGGTNCWSSVYGITEKYDLLEHQWFKCKKLNYPRYGHGNITINERYIFVTGGCDRFYDIMNCELYDRKYDKWIEYSSMLKPVQKCNVLKFHDDIFVIGGKDRTVQIFNYEKKFWRFGPKLNDITSKRGSKLCTFDYKLIAMNKDDITKYEIYDKSSNRWYCTNIRNHPIHKIYPKPFIHSDNIFDWFHLGRRYW